MHWSVSVSYENGKAVGVRWHDCGVGRPSLCAVPMNPTNFTDARPEGNRDPVTGNERFLRACGVPPTDLRDELLVLRGDSRY